MGGARGFCAAQGGQGRQALFLNSFSNSTNGGRFESRKTQERGKEERQRKRRETHSSAAKAKKVAQHEHSSKQPYRLGGTSLGVVGGTHVHAWGVLIDLPARSTRSGLPARPGPAREFSPKPNGPESFGRPLVRLKGGHLAPPSPFHPPGPGPGFV